METTTYSDYDIFSHENYDHTVPIYLQHYMLCHTMVQQIIPYIQPKIDNYRCAGVPSRLKIYESLWLFSVISELSNLGEKGGRGGGQRWGHPPASTVILPVVDIILQIQLYLIAYSFYPLWVTQTFGIYNKTEKTCHYQGTNAVTEFSSPDKVRWQDSRKQR